MHLFRKILELDANLKVKGERKLLNAKFYGTDKKKMTISSKEELDKILKELEGASYEVAEIKKGERTKKAPVPFTTSTLQQEASKRLNMSTQKTMRLAQELYEGVNLKRKRKYWSYYLLKNRFDTYFRRSR